MIPTPLTITYDTDNMFEPDEEDLKDRKILSIEDAEGKTVVYTDSGYFHISQERAEYLVEAINQHEQMKQEINTLRLAVAKMAVEGRQQQVIKSGFLSAMNWMYHDTADLVRKTGPVDRGYDDAFLRDLINLRAAYNVLKKGVPHVG